MVISVLYSEQNGLYKILTIIIIHHFTEYIHKRQLGIKSFVH